MATRIDCLVSTPSSAMPDETHDESKACLSEKMVFFGADDVIPVQNSRVARGGFGEVSLAIYSPQCRVVAVKTLFQPSSRQAELMNHEAENEISALRLLSSHENIVSLLAMHPCSSIGSSMSLAFDYCPTDLALTLEWRRRSFLPLLSMNVVTTIAKDLFAALLHMHSLNLLHLDVKPANLLVSPTGHIQLCDFGLSQSIAAINKRIENGETPRALCTLQYRSPEMLLGCPPSQASIDMYSAGLVVCELLLGRPLFAGRSVLDQLSCIFSALGTPTNETWPGATDTPDYGKLNFTAVQAKKMEEFLPRATESDHIADLLERLVRLDPEKRLSSQQVAEHALWQNERKPDSRHDLVIELIPEQLEEPVLLSVDGEVARQVGQRQIQALASRRRQLLSTLGPSLQNS